MFRLVTAGVLNVVSAYPDPPFEIKGASSIGFDIDLIQAIATELHLQPRLNRYNGADFNGIFDSLEKGIYDVVISGTTITPAREKLASFCDPYIKSGQSLVVNVKKNPSVKSIDNLQGRTIAVQLGNTSEPVALQLKAEGKAASVKIYAYDEIMKALDDLEKGLIDAFMKLEPVMHWLTKDRPVLKVVQTGLTDERIAIAVHRNNVDLAAAINSAQKTLAAKGAIAAFSKKWLSACDPRTTKVLL